MELAEFISNANDDELIQVGSNTGWLWFGTKATAATKLYKINDYLLEQTKKNIRTAKRQLKTCKNLLEEVYPATLADCNAKIARLEQELELTEDEKKELKAVKKRLSATKRYIKQNEDKLRGLPKKVADLQTKLGWQLDNPLLIREVVSAYRNTILEPYSICAVVEGPEIGEYWLYSEWASTHKEEKDGNF